MDLASNLETAMRARGWNAYALAEASGVPQPTIHRILTGKHLDPRSTTVRDLARALDLIASDLIGDAPNTTSRSAGKEAPIGKEKVKLAALRAIEAGAPDVSVMWPFEGLQPQQWEELSPVDQARIDGFAQGVWQSQMGKSKAG